MKPLFVAILFLFSFQNILGITFDKKTEISRNKTKAVQHKNKKRDLASPDKEIKDASGKGQELIQNLLNCINSSSSREVLKNCSDKYFSNELDHRDRLRLLMWLGQKDVLTVPSSCDEKMVPLLNNEKGKNIVTLCSKFHRDDLYKLVIFVFSKNNNQLYLMNIDERTRASQF